MSALRPVSETLGRALALLRQGPSWLDQRVGPRWTPLVLAALTWLLVVLAGALVFGNPAPGSSFHRSGALLLDRWNSALPYPFTVQNLQHLVFALAVAELWVAARRAQAEAAWLAQGLLPEDEHSMLQAEDLGPVRRRVIGQFDAEQGFLPAMVDLCVLQFFASRSVEQTLAVLESKRALLLHQVAARYRGLRAAAGALVALGVVAALAGLAAALAVDSPARLPLLAGALDPAIVGVAEAALLWLGIGIVQGQEERAVQHGGRYVLHHLINRLYTGRAAAD
jgi:hypothetical protein